MLSVDCVLTVIDNKHFNRDRKGSFRLTESERKSGIIFFDLYGCSIEFIAVSRKMTDLIFLPTLYIWTDASILSYVKMSYMLKI